jgi:hypothetical protein
MGGWTVVKVALSEDDQDEDQDDQELNDYYCCWIDSWIDIDG